MIHGISELFQISQFWHNPIWVIEDWLETLLPHRDRLHNSRISFDIEVFLSSQNIEGTNSIVEDKIYGMRISIFSAALESSASSETIGKTSPISPLPPLL